MSEDPNNPNSTSSDHFDFSPLETQETQGTQETDNFGTSENNDSTIVKSEFKFEPNLEWNWKQNESENLWGAEADADSNPLTKNENINNSFETNDNENEKAIDEDSPKTPENACTTNIFLESPENKDEHDSDNFIFGNEDEMMSNNNSNNDGYWDNNVTDRFAEAKNNLSSSEIFSHQNFENENFSFENNEEIPQFGFSETKNEEKKETTHEWGININNTVQVPDTSIIEESEESEESEIPEIPNFENEQENKIPEEVTHVTMDDGYNYQIRDFSKSTLQVEAPTSETDKYLSSGNFKDSLVLLSEELKFELSPFPGQTSPAYEEFEKPKNSKKKKLKTIAEIEEEKKKQISMNGIEKIPKKKKKYYEEFDPSKNKRKNEKSKSKYLEKLEYKFSSEDRKKTKSKRRKLILAREICLGNFETVKALIMEQKISGRLNHEDLNESLFLLVRRKRIDFVSLLLDSGVISGTDISSLVVSTALYEPYFCKHVFTKLMEFIPKQLFEEFDHCLEAVKNIPEAYNLYVRRFE